ncbi:hypothetical protein BGZ90_004230 [Linnemannia elongata]|nr:hypothetical protein BGZ90_004230 [Linnemannia elongata]
MAAHLATHDPPYTDFGYCSAKGCLFYYWTRDDAEEHFSSHPTHDSKQRPYKCTTTVDGVVCHRSFMTAYRLKQHQYDTHRDGFPCRLGCGQTFKQQQNRQLHEHNIPHVQTGQLQVPEGLLGFSNFHDFALTVTDQAYLLGAGLDDSNGEFDETVEYDEKDKTETGDQAGRDLYQGSSLSLGPVEGERAGGVSCPENEADDVVDFQGRQCIDAIPSGTLQAATLTIIVHSSHEFTLESAVVVFETDNYTLRFVVDKGVPRKVWPVEASNIKKLIHLGFEYHAKQDVTSRTRITYKGLLAAHDYSPRNVIPTILQKEGAQAWCPEHCHINACSKEEALRRLALHRVAKANGNMTIQSTLDLVCLVVANGFSTGPVQLDEDQRLRVRAQAISSQAMDFYTGLPLEIDRSNGPYKFTVEGLRPGLLYDDTEQMRVPSALFFIEKARSNVDGISTTF